MSYGGLPGPLGSPAPAKVSPKPALAGGASLFTPSAALGCGAGPGRVGDWKFFLSGRSSSRPWLLWVGPASGLCGAGLAGTPD